MDDATTYLTPAGTRRKINTTGVEIDNPYFNVQKNRLGSKTNRLISNLGVRITPFSWGSIKTNLGSDTYTGQYLVNRHPESNYATSVNGILDQNDNIAKKPEGGLRMERIAKNMTFKRPMDLELGPDGCLYLIETGTAWEKNKDTQIVRLEYTGPQD